MPSIFSVKANPAADADPVTIDTDGDKIVVLLSKKNHDAYRTLRQTPAYASVLGAAVIAPALAAVLEEMRFTGSSEGAGDMTSRHWYGVLARRLDALGLDAADLENLDAPSMVIANRVIGQPLDAYFDSLIKLSQDAEEED